MAKMFCFGYAKWTSFLFFSMSLMNTKHTMHLNALVEKQEASTSISFLRTMDKRLRGPSCCMLFSLATIIRPLEKRFSARSLPLFTTTVLDICLSTARSSAKSKPRSIIWLSWTSFVQPRSHSSTRNSSFQYFGLRSRRSVRPVRDHRMFIQRNLHGRRFLLDTSSKQLAPTAPVLILFALARSSVDF